MIVLARRGEAWRRGTIAAAIIVLHLAVAAVLLRSQHHINAPTEQVSMTVREVSEPPRVERAALVEAPLDAGLELPSIEIAASVDQASASCDVPAALGPVLQADSATLAALAVTTAGPESAIMAWNGGWAHLLGIQPLHQAVAASLRTSRAACLDEPLTGPRLVFVPVSGATVTIAFGSGSWSWRELLSNDQ